jgi:hypothetical protein
MEIAMNLPPSRIAAVAAVTFFVALGAADASGPSRQCTIRPPKGANAAVLQALPTVSREDALKTAIDSLKTRAAVSVAESELEVEHGCLVWSFDLEVDGAKGIEEVQVDAGDGRVVDHEHESAKHEKEEKAAEAK